MSAPSSPARNLHDRLVKDSRANRPDLCDVSPEPIPTAPPDQTLKLRASSDLLKHVKSMRHLDNGLYQALRERQEIAQLSSDPNVLLQEIDRQKAELKAAGLDKPSLFWRLRNAFASAEPSDLTVTIFSLLVAIYVVLYLACLYSTLNFKHPPSVILLALVADSLSIAWILRGPDRRIEGLGLLAFSLMEAWVSAGDAGPSATPVTSFLTAIMMVCLIRESRHVTACVFLNLWTVGFIPRFGTDAPIRWTQFNSPWERFNYQLSAWMAIVLGIWIPCLWVNWLYSLFILPTVSSWVWRSLLATTKRYRNTEGRKRQVRLIVNGVPTWVEMGTDDTAPSVVRKNDPVPAQPAEVEHVQVFNQQTGQYEWQQVFRGGNPNVKPDVEPVIPGVEHGSAYEMTDDEGDAIGATRSDLPTPPIPL